MAAVMAAMGKFDIAELQAAYRGAQRIGIS